LALLGRALSFRGLGSALTTLLPHIIESLNYKCTKFVPRASTFVHALTIPISKTTPILANHGDHRSSTDISQDVRSNRQVVLITGIGCAKEGWGDVLAIATLLARQGAIIFGCDVSREASGIAMFRILADSPKTDI
jgi:hypothetical protein